MKTEQLVHRVLNRLAQGTCSEEMLADLAKVMADQAGEGGHCLNFPTLLTPDGRCALGIALYAPIDERTARMRAIAPVLGATHVFVLLLFENEAQWFREAKSFQRVYPPRDGADYMIVDKE